MMPVMVKEADRDWIDVPEDYEVLDATALGRRLEQGMRPNFLLDRYASTVSRLNPKRLPTVLTVMKMSGSVAVEDRGQ